MDNPLQYVKDEWDDFWYKYSDERIDLARHRIRVHNLYMKGECPVNPYTEPDSNWYNY